MARYVRWATMVALWLVVMVSLLQFIEATKHNINTNGAVVATAPSNEAERLQRQHEQRIRDSILEVRAPVRALSPPSHAHIPLSSL